ncbi:MAG: hypothetical protein KIT11_00810 [Fimbriimonadaceae bacterium]|nr:hypothetical protein [Fimbriimonadaceae bacterium]QYK55086.1 MAG: hypothetical protein KF733_08725 [Fimbriimonadaceae bacterium]
MNDIEATKTSAEAAGPTIGIAAAMGAVVTTTTTTVAGTPALKSATNMAVL